ncbi:hypothetical protein ANANG_G00140300 [Anguilla anguilla]|uniref:Uncharacterized protein n=1 Tax=Anguilla anguilla TaxID=7936 RepID=A0A9D3RXY1_ANGAN|nr:hypothetical protein ANANG_G00140300 [Anguilla anguilla]
MLLRLTIKYERTALRFWNDGSPQSAGEGAQGRGTWQGCLEEPRCQPPHPCGSGCQRCRAESRSEGEREECREGGGPRVEPAHRLTICLTHARVLMGEQQALARPSPISPIGLMKIWGSFPKSNTALILNY